MFSLIILYFIYWGRVICWTRFSLSTYPACHGRARLPRERIPRVLLCPPDCFLGVGGLCAVSCACATSIVSPSIQLLGSLRRKTDQRNRLDSTSGQNIVTFSPKASCEVEKDGSLPQYDHSIWKLSHGDRLLFIYRIHLPVVATTLYLNIASCYAKKENKWYKPSLPQPPTEARS